MQDQIKDALRQLGYLQEEEYFYNKNKELLARRRKEIDQKRSQRAAESKKRAYWMVCPNCGHVLEETMHSAIWVSRCASCRGIYIDAEELDLLLEVRTETGRVRNFFMRLLK